MFNKIKYFNINFLCSFADVIATTSRPKTPCLPSPCGSNAECKVVNYQEVCTCLPGFTGNPPLCRPECVINAECPSNLACIQQKCKDPCNGACGIRALCTVVNHNAICSCPTGFRGDPFVQCTEIPPGKFHFQHSHHTSFNHFSTLSS